MPATTPLPEAPRHAGHREGAATMILLEHVSKRYDMDGVGVTALEDVQLEVDEGEFVVVLGASHG